MGSLVLFRYNDAQFEIPIDKLISVDAKNNYFLVRYYDEDDNEQQIAGYFLKRKWK